MADRESTPRIARKSSATGHSTGHSDIGTAGTTRITDAQCLSLAQQLVVLDESTELPPFGMCMVGLQERLKRRLGLEISEVCQPLLSTYSVRIIFAKNLRLGYETHEKSGFFLRRYRITYIQMRDGLCLPLAWPPKPCRFCTRCLLTFNNAEALDWQRCQYV